MKLNIPAQLDTSIRPQDDFFNHVNKKWLHKHPIPDSEASWGTFGVLRNESWKAMHAIYESLQQETFKAGSIQQQARDFYSTGLNYNQLEATHLQEVRRLLQHIEAIDHTSDLSRIMGELNSMQISSPVYPWVDTDHDDSTRHILHFSQGGLTLPNRDYYLDTSDRMKEIRTKYKEYILAVFERFPELARSQDELLQCLLPFETRLAHASRTPIEERDIEKNFNKTSFASLKETYTAMDWDIYARAFGWTPSDAISVDQPDFLAHVTREIAETPLNDWKVYLKWRVINACLSKISMPYTELHFSFFGKVLNGAKELMPLWKRVVLAADATLGEATGRLYAEQYFPESSKQAVLQLVEDVRAAYGERIELLDWMSDETKQYAKQKLANIKVLIGYPDTWRDFTRLSIHTTSYLANILQANKFDMAYWLDKLHQPISRDDWFMNPQTVNAYHDPTRLVICFPAAILQAPFFDPKASLAINMGGIGTVIGHELSHGFDDQGCQFDATGTVRNWQTKAEREAFAKKAQVIVDQADAFSILPGLHLKGKLVLGESIADLGGIEIALQALKASSHTDLDMLKEFFINYTFSECSAIREEKLREYTLSDPHPASEYRVNGILQHVNDFYDAFEIREGDLLYRDASSRARIW